MPLPEPRVWGASYPSLKPNQKDGKIPQMRPSQAAACGTLPDKGDDLAGAQTYNILEESLPGLDVVFP